MAQPLVDDLIKEVLLRFPPDEPERLLHAALVYKGWRRTVSDPSFHHRFCEHHRRTRPLLGFVYYHRAPARFIPTTALPPDDSCTDYLPLDSHHDDVVLLDVLSLQPQLGVVMGHDPSGLFIAQHDSYIF